MAIEESRRYAKKRLDHLGPEDIRHYQVALLEGKKLGCQGRKTTDYGRLAGGSACPTPAVLPPVFSLIDSACLA